MTNSDRPRKINLQRLTNDLLSEINDIELQEIPQGEKTRKYKLAAQRFKNALFNDRRKYRGRGLQNRISLKTFNTYLSRVRRLFDDRLHHAFYNNINKLAAQHPIYFDELKSWLTLQPQNIRIKLSELQEKLKKGIHLSEKYTEKRKNYYIKNYPEWATEIENGIFNEAIKQGVELLDQLSKLKINHEILYSLTLSSAERATIIANDEQKLSNKKRSTITIDYQKYIQSIFDILNRDYNADDITTRSAMAPLAFALAAVSGRRAIEIIYTGVFEKLNKYSLKFAGQAKKRVEDVSFNREIYCLCDTDLFLDKLSILRNSASAKDLFDLEYDAENAPTVTINALINTRISLPFTTFAKQFFNDDRRVFKDTRAIYARISYELYFKTDPRWQNIDEDVFFSEILGHDDEKTQLHYKQFKIINLDREWRPQKNTMTKNNRLIELEKLDEYMPDFARGDSAIKLHEWVKERIRADPDAKITTYTLRKERSTNPELARRYLDFAADALGMKINDDGRLKMVETVEPAIIVNATEVEPEKTIIKEKPRFKAPLKQNDGSWYVEYEYSGQNYAWHGVANNPVDAMKKAFKENHK